MENTKKFTIKVDGIEQSIENVDKLSDSLEKTKIEALSAKKLMQEIADDTPNAASKIEETLNKLRKKFEKQNEEIQKAAGVYAKHIAATDELFKSFYGTKSNEAMAKQVTELATASAKLTITMQQIQDLNEKAYKTLEKTTAAKLAANQAEIDGLAKSAKSLQQLIEKYEERKKLLADQAEVAKAAVAAEYEEMKKAGADAVLMEQHKAEQIAAIEAKLKESLKQNAKDYEAAAKAYNDRLFSSFTGNMEATVDRSAKKTKKLADDTKETAKKTAAEIAKEFGFAEGSIDNIAIAAMQAQEKSKAATVEAEKTTEAAAKTAEATKKMIDIDATRKNIDVAVKGLEHYRTALYQNGKYYIAEYDEQIKAAGENAEEVKRLEAEKAKAVKFYAEEIIKTNQAITAAQKKEQGLSMLQWKQHVENVREIVKNINKYSVEAQKYTDDLKTRTESLNKELKDFHKEEISEFTDKIKEKGELVQKHDENLVKFEEEKNNRINELRQQGLTDEQIANDATVASLKNKIDNETALRDKEAKAKEDYENKKAKKEKHRKQQQKIYDKIEMTQKIVSASSDISAGVAKALSYGPILGPILAAIVTAAGAYQIAIMTRNLTKFEDGGLLRGKRHTQGGMRIEGTNIEVEGGEYVVNRVSTDKNIGLIRYINSQRRELTPADISTFFAKSPQGFEPPFSRAFESGGQLPAIATPDSIDNETLVEAIRSIRIEPRVSVTDINRVQGEMVSVDNWVGL